MILNLILKGADINGADSLGRTPLYVAALNGKLEAVKALIKRKALVNTSPSPLAGAVQGGNEFVIKFLIESGATL